MHKTLTVPAALLALAAFAGSASAQTPPPPPAPPAHQGVLGRIFHPRSKPGQPAQGSFSRPGQTRPYGQTNHFGRPGAGMSSAMGGSIVGNKNTHVYHMAGDRGAMPAPQNRVYFPSAAAAEAAGYRAAGGGRGMNTRRPMTRTPMMHGSPRTGTPMPNGMTR